MTDEGITLRDYFAARVPDWWNTRRPSTIGQAKREMAARGMITHNEANTHSFAPSPALWSELECRIAYEYADAMLKARGASA